MCFGFVWCVSVWQQNSVFSRAEKIAVIFLAHRKISIANPGWSDGRIVTCTLSIVSLHANY